MPIITVSLINVTFFIPRKSLCKIHTLVMLMKLYFQSSQTAKHFFSYISSPNYKAPNSATIHIEAPLGNSYANSEIHSEAM
ncbi:hypothetical protein RJT34_25548 [Clitoria ternatea]|uniref:Uncharacterized protein n=1 Tax=Clitoria ternatea TaxID=43366 RepID=A0AAN9FQ25_CLITE